MSMSICKTEDVTFAGMPRRGSRYDGVIDNMRKLKAGQTLKLPVAKGTTIQVAMNRLNSALYQRGPTAPKGCVWEKAALTDNVIGISVVRNKDSRATRRAAAAKKVKARPRKKAKPRAKKKAPRKAKTKAKK